MDDTSSIPDAAPHSGAQGRLNARLLAAMIFAASLGLLVVAAWLDPSSKGTGTHRQLGLPSCGLLEATGIPCATCGMTTAFAYAADGRLIQSFITQPAGALLAIMVATLVAASGFSMVTGMPLSPLFKGFFRPVPVIVFGVFIALAWMYKVAAVTGFMPSP